MRKRLLVLLVAAVAGVLVFASPASAHPLGNFSVNRYAEVTVRADRLDALVVADIAELPTLQDPAPSCSASGLTVSVDGGPPLAWTVVSSSVASVPGAGGLATTRMECRLSAAWAGAGRVAVAHRFRDDRIGWRELVAAAGPGMVLSSSTLPAAGVSAALRRYPDDLLSSPPSVGSGTFVAARAAAGSEPAFVSGLGARSDLASGPGSPSDPASGPGSPSDPASAPGLGSVPGSASGPGAPSGPGSGSLSDPASASGSAPASGAGSSVAGPGGLPSGGAALEAAGPLAGAERWLMGTVGGRSLTPWVGILAVLLALVLGAGHAVLPGHGKTIMAAYLAGRQGRRRDALTVGATVTATHTGAVLALGLLLTTVPGIAGESILSYLGLTSGIVVTALGLTALFAARRGPLDAHGHHHHGHTHTHTHTHEPHTHAKPHTHGRPETPTHSHAEPHSHDVSIARGGSHTHGEAGSHAHGGAGSHAHADGETLSHPKRQNDTKPHSHDEPDSHAVSATHAGSHTRGQHSHGTHSHSTHSHGTHSHGPHSHGPHSHDHPRGDHGGRRPSRFSLAGLGIAGGLVPSPSALIVLLGAAALGRTVFGVLLVLAYGLGMAATLTAAGLLLIKVRDRLEGRLHKLTRLRAAMPSITGLLIITVGLGLAGRAAFALM